MSGMGCYRDRIYYNMSLGLPFYQCDKNGSNRKLLAKLNERGDYENLMIELPMFFVEEEAIFGMTYFDFLTEPIEKEDGAIIAQERLWMLGKINLESGQFEIVKEPVKLGDSEWIIMGDYIDGKIFYTKAGGDNQNNHRYDLKNNEDTLLFTQGDSQIRYLGIVHEIQKIIYMEQKGDTYHVYALGAQTGKTESVFQKETETGKEIYLGMAGEEKKITENEYRHAPITAETDDWYVGTTEDGTVCIPKNSYDEKDWDKVQVIGSF